MAAKIVLTLSVMLLAGHACIHTSEELREKHTSGDHNAQPVPENNAGLLSVSSLTTSVSVGLAVTGAAFLGVRIIKSFMRQMDENGVNPHLQQPPVHNNNEHD